MKKNRCFVGIHYFVETRCSYYFARDCRFPCSYRRGSSFLRGVQRKATLLMNRNCYSFLQKRPYCTNFGYPQNHQSRLFQGQELSCRGSRVSPFRLLNPRPKGLLQLPYTCWKWNHKPGLRPYNEALFSHLLCTNRFQLQPLLPEGVRRRSFYIAQALQGCKNPKEFPQSENVPFLASFASAPQKFLRESIARCHTQPATPPYRYFYSIIELCRF